MLCIVHFGCFYFAINKIIIILQSGDLKNGPRTVSAASFPPTLNGGPPNPGVVDGPGGPPAGPPMQQAPQDMQPAWMPNLQSPTHSRPPMQQGSPYMNGIPGQPQPGMNRGPVPPGMLYICSVPKQIRKVQNLTASLTYLLYGVWISMVVYMGSWLTLNLQLETWPTVHT